MKVKAPDYSFLAKNGGLVDLEPRLLTSKNLCALHNPCEVNEGTLSAPIHLAAKANRLKDIPVAILEANLLLRDGEDSTVLSLGYHQVPKKMLTHENMMYVYPGGHISVMAEITYKNWGKKQDLTTDIPERLCTPANMVMACATFGILHKLPDSYLTKENFDQKNCNGQTPLHLAAHRGFLPVMPRQFLTLQNLLRLDNYGDDPLRAAARISKLGRLPSKDLSLDFVPDLAPEKWAMLPAERRTHLLEVFGGMAVAIPDYMIAPWEHLQPAGTWAGL